MASDSTFIVLSIGYHADLVLFNELRNAWDALLEQIGDAPEHFVYVPKIQREDMRDTHTLRFRVTAEAFRL
jgi:hypothetical protein